MCLEDGCRTPAFIRGIVLAVRAALARRGDNRRPIHLLEAGCGPLATLAIPVMTQFDPGDLQVTLIDLHQASIDCAVKLIQKPKIVTSWVASSPGIAPRR